MRSVGDYLSEAAVPNRVAAALASLSVASALVFLLYKYPPPPAPHHQRGTDDGRPVNPHGLAVLSEELTTWLRRRAEAWGPSVRVFPVKDSPSPRLLEALGEWDEFKRISNDTSIACRHFDLPVDEPKMLRHYKRQPPLRCQENEQWATLDEENRVQLTQNRSLDLACNVTELYRVEDCVIIPLSTYHVEQHYQEYQLRYTDTVEVECTDRNTGRRWVDFLLGTPKWGPKYFREEEAAISAGPSAGTRLQSAAKDVPYLNVLIWTFDSTTRNTFIRMMPKSWDYMETRMKGVLLKGYNVVGLNTVHALTGLFLGRRLQSFYPDTPYVERRYVEDYTPNKTLFETFRRHGYVTAMLEDESNWGTYVYFQPGFRKPPADHYTRAFMFERGKVKGFRPQCCGNISCNMVAQNYFKRLWALYPTRPKLFFAIQGTYSHAVLPENLGLIDEEFRDFLAWAQDPDRGGLRNDTVIVVMGDHGHRLSTPMDLHVTLKSLLSLGNVDFGALPPAPDAPGAGPWPTAMNLFQPMPKERTCEMAEVAAHWCACPMSKSLDPEGPQARKMGQALVTFLNNLVAREQRKYLTQNQQQQRLRNNSAADATAPFKCATWTLRAVKHASQVHGGQGAMKRQFQMSPLVDHTRLTYFEVGVETDPGPSNFHGTWEYDRHTRKYKIRSGDVTRLDWYSSHSHCVDHVKTLRMWCYCSS